MTQHAPLLPLLIPFAAALLQMLMPLARQRQVAALSAALSIASTLWLLVLCDAGPLRVYALGDWQPPFGIVLVADRLAALMVFCCALLAAACVAYASAGADAHGRNFHPLFQLQLLGINGAFLTGDLFNLFVFFEIMLLASYALLAQSGGLQRTRAGMVYVVINLLGSSLFLIALGTLYGALGTLNLADVAHRATQVGSNDALLRVALLLLVAVFVLKAALLPLSFWLPQTYAAAMAPVAALFSIMTKVGIVALFRLHALVLQPLFPELTSGWLSTLALATLLFGMLGVLAAPSLRTLAAWLILISAGTLQNLPSFGTPEATAAGIFYLVHSTFVGAAFFLLAELVGEQRGSRLCSFGPDAAEAKRAAPALGIAFFVLAISVAGLPPFSGFIGKLLILRSTAGSALSAPLQVALWAALLAAAFGVSLALARAGSRLFWQGSAPHAVSTAPDLRFAALVFLVVCAPLVTLFAQPVVDYATRAARQVHDGQAYVRDVLGTPPEAAPARTVRPNRTPYSGERSP